MADFSALTDAVNRAEERLLMAIGTLGGTANPLVDATRMIVSGDKVGDLLGEYERAIREHAGEMALERGLRESEAIPQEAEA